MRATARRATAGTRLCCRHVPCCPRAPYYYDRAAVTTISTFHRGFASLASTVARAGALPGATQASHACKAARQRGMWACGCIRRCCPVPLQQRAMWVFGGGCVKPQQACGAAAIHAMPGMPPRCMVAWCVGPLLALASLRSAPESRPGLGCTPVCMRSGAQGRAVLRAGARRDGHAPRQLSRSASILHGRLQPWAQTSALQCVVSGVRWVGGRGTGRSRAPAQTPGMAPLHACMHARMHAAWPCTCMPARSASPAPMRDTMHLRKQNLRLVGACACQQRVDLTQHVLRLPLGVQRRVLRHLPTAAAARGRTDGATRPSRVGRDAHFKQCASKRAKSMRMQGGEV